MIIAIIILAIAFAAFTYKKPEWAAIALAAALPTYGIRFSFWGVPSTLLEVLIWSLAVGWFVRTWHDRGAPRLPRMHEALSEQNVFSPYLLPIFLWLIVSLAAVIISPLPQAAFGIWKAYFLDAVMAFAVVTLILKNKPERKYLLSALGFSLVCVALLAWYQRFTGQLLPAPWNTNIPLRVTSWYSYPNAVGLFLGPIAAMYFTWFLKLLRTPSKWFHELVTKVFVLILGFGAIIFAVSKGAWVGVAAGCFIGAFISLGLTSPPPPAKLDGASPSRALRALLSRAQWQLLVTSIVIAAFVLIVPQIRARVLDEFLFQSPSGQIRKVVWEESVAMLKDYPLTGAGLAGYQTALVPYHVAWRHDISPYKLEIFLYPHNILLNFWTELGLAGVIVFIWLIVIFFKLAWSKREQPLAVIAMAGMTALLIHGLVDVPYFKNDLSVLFWLIMALPLLEPTLHRAHRDDKWFDLIVAGEKTIEARLYDEKRKLLRIGDRVILRRRPTGEEMIVEVIQLHRARTFAELLTQQNPEDFGFHSADHGLEEIRKYYSENDEAIGGVLGIRIRVIVLPKSMST